MPITRGRARYNEVQEEEEIGQELSQQLPDMQQEREEEDHQTSTEVKAQGADLKEMAKQLTKTLKHLLTTHRQLENDAAMIQAGMDELHRMQEARAEHIVGRLKNASSTILTFGNVSPGKHPEYENDGNEESSIILYVFLPAMDKDLQTSTIELPSQGPLGITPYADVIS